MANSTATSTARRGSIFRLQLASLLRPLESSRVIGGGGLPRSLLRSLGQRPKPEGSPESRVQNPEPQIPSSKSARPGAEQQYPKVDASQGDLKIQLSFDAPRATGLHPAAP